MVLRLWYRQALPTSIRYTPSSPNCAIPLILRSSHKTMSGRKNALGSYWRTLAYSGAISCPRMMWIHFSIFWLTASLVRCLGLCRWRGETNYNFCASNMLCYVNPKICVVLEHLVYDPQSVQVMIDGLQDDYVRTLILDKVQSWASEHFIAHDTNAQPFHAHWVQAELMVQDLGGINKAPQPPN